MNEEQQRLEEDRLHREACRLEGIPPHGSWKKWGPYVTERQWGTVREDYSRDGTAWDSITHDQARSRAYRWGEEGIAGFCDDRQILCFAIALWNRRDPILKERMFGLTGSEGNHGEDCKEHYYYLDSSPTHSYMKMLYKYPQAEYPYRWLVEENRRRGKAEPEFELVDTGVFDGDRYFDVFVEYAKVAVEDTFVRITVENRGPEDAELDLLPTIWFRNTWSWGLTAKPTLRKSGRGVDVDGSAVGFGHYRLECEGEPDILVCENETNAARLFGFGDAKGPFKDGIDAYVVHGDAGAVASDGVGTKASAHHRLVVPARGSVVVRLRLSKVEPNASPRPADPFAGCDAAFEARRRETDVFYDAVQQDVQDADLRMVQRQAFAGMLWSKQFFYYNVAEWLKGDPGHPAPPPERWKGRNKEWAHLNNADVISMPDKWEYPWFAAWDLAFHCVTFAIVDPDFAKEQLVLLTREWYMHPNGQLPAYEWAFSDVNPPVHAWAAWRVYQIEKKANGGRGDLHFLESILHKLMLNFTWWVNRKDAGGNNIFEGGFLGLDNIGVFDRSAPLPTGGYIEQSDGTSWMAMYALNLMRISLEIGAERPVYQDIATKFFEHFMYIASAMSKFGRTDDDLWDDVDEFFYDVLNKPDGERIPLKVQSMVGFIPMFAVETLDPETLKKVPAFARRLTWFLEHRPELAQLVSRWSVPGRGETRLFSLLRGHRLKRLLARMLDEDQFLSDYGVRALSKRHRDHPYVFEANGQRFTVAYDPGESSTGLFGGNSNWRGPIWMPVNYLIVESLQRFHYYYGDDFTVEYPVGSGKTLTLEQVAAEISRRLVRIFTLDENGRRPVHGDVPKLQNDPNFRDHLLFYEYFHGDSGRGVGATHQTGWTGLVAKLIHPRSNVETEPG